MIYKFDVFLDDKDYYEYNKFHILHSPYGKKQKKTIGIIFAVFALIVLIMMTIVESFLAAVIAAIPMVILGVIMTLLYPLIVLLVVKIQIALMKKSPKKNYSPKSTVQFLDETFVEETEVGKTETKYFVIDRISVTEQAIYMHMNAVLAYILPTSLFESDEALDEFIDFLKTKNEKIFIHTRRKIC